MSYRTDRRRRQIAAKGRPLLLARADGSASVTVTGYAPPAGAARLDSAVPVTALIVQIGTDELATRPDIDRPRAGDTLADGPALYSVTAANPVWDGDQLSGWTIIVDGGQ